jgi:adenylate kinase
MTNIIIAAYAGTGKTTLANAYPQKFTDFVCMPYTTPQLKTLSHYVNV